eukprot:scaffold15075_cov13-Prasinocladus_malaysianus.AAC.1
MLHFISRQAIGEVVADMENKQLVIASWEIVSPRLNMYIKLPALVKGNALCIVFCFQSFTMQKSECNQT